MTQNFLIPISHYTTLLQEDTKYEIYKSTRTWTKFSAFFPVKHRIKVRSSFLLLNVSISGIQFFLGGGGGEVGRYN